MWHITIRLARIWLYTKMRPYGESSNGLAALSPSPFWLGYITNISGYNFRKGQDQIGMLSETERAIFGRSYAAEPDVLVEQLRQDEAIAEADTLLLTVPNQLGVDYNAHVIEAILKHVAPGLGWREGATRTTARDASIP